MSFRGLLNGYVDLLDGVRGYYARREHDGSSTAFSAAMLLSTLMAVNFASVTMLFDMVCFRELRIAHWVAAHRGFTLVVLAGIGIAHVAIAKVTGVYDRRGPTISSTWAWKMKGYLVATAVLVLASLASIPLLAD